MSIDSKRWRQYHLSFWGVFLILSSCTFEPHDEYISQLQPPEPVAVSFIINDPAFNDPYYLLGATRFYFRLKELDNPIVSTEVKLNGVPVSSAVINNNVVFLLEPDRMKVGSHNVDMTLHVDTESGSLANQLGGEYYIIKQSFTAIIDPNPPVFNSFEGGVENGLLSLRWSVPLKSNFVYKIKRTGGSNSVFLSDTVLFDTNADHFIDPGFVGGSVHYKVVASGYGFEKPIGSGTVELAPADFDVIKDDEGIVRLQWSNSYVDIENVQLSIRTSRNVLQERSFPFTPSGNINLGTLDFKDQIEVWLTLFRKGYSTQATKINFHLPAVPNIKPFTRFNILTPHHKLLIATEDKLYRYSLDGFVLEDSLSLPSQGIHSLVSLAVSPDGSRAFVSGEGGSLISFDPVEFGKITRHDIRPTTTKISGSEDVPHVVLGNVSNNGFLTAHFSIWRVGYYTMVFDTNTSQDIWHSPPGNDFAPTISDDGKYLAADIGVPDGDYEGWVFKRDGNGYTNIGKIEAGHHLFLPGGAEVMSFSRLGPYYNPYEGAFLSVFNLLDPPHQPDESFNRIRNLDLPYSESIDLLGISYDELTGSLILRYPDVVKLMDPATLSYEKTIDGNQIYFSSNYLINASGFIEAFK